MHKRYCELKTVYDHELLKCETQNEDIKHQAMMKNMAMEMLALKLLCGDETIPYETESVVQRTSMPHEPQKHPQAYVYDTNKGTAANHMERIIATNDPRKMDSMKNIIFEIFDDLKIQRPMAYEKFVAKFAEVY